MRTGGVIVLTTLAAVSQPVFAQVSPPPPPPEPLWDMVAFEVKSWGEPETSWRIARNGGGSWVETVRKDGARLGDYTLVYHEIEPQVANYIAIERILAELPDPAPDSSNCTEFMTDLAYGTIRLTKGATTTEISWNSGCQDESYKRFIDQLKAADQMVRAWGKEGKVLRSETRP